MIEALNRTQGRAATSGGMFFAEPDTIDEDVDAQASIARIGNALCPFSPIDRVAYARQVAAVVLDAKRKPRNGYARPTL